MNTEIRRRSVLKSGESDRRDSSSRRFLSQYSDSVSSGCDDVEPAGFFTEVDALIRRAGAKKTTDFDELNTVLKKFRAWDATQMRAAELDKGRLNQAEEVSYERALHSIARYRRRDGDSSQRERGAAGQRIKASEDDAPVPADPQAGERVRMESPEIAVPKRSRKEGVHANDRKSALHDQVAATESAKGKSPGPPVRRRQPSFASAVKRELATRQELEQSPIGRDRHARASALTIRLTEDELALIRRRAVEASLSVSGYLRQCALEVETLREHVEGVLEELRAARRVAEGGGQRRSSSAATTSTQMMRRGLMERFRASLVNLFSAVVTPGARENP